MCQIWTVELLRNFKHKKLVLAHIDASITLCLLLMVDIRFRKLLILSNVTSLPCMRVYLSHSETGKKLPLIILSK